MSDCMTFPDTVEEFMEQYKIIDTKQVYTNGTEFVPIFRMKQWFEHLQPDRMKLVQQAVNTIISTSRSYSIRDRAFRNAARFVQCAIDGEAPDFEQIPEGDEMPSEPQWIPVSERLPDEGVHILISIPDGVTYGWFNGCYFVQDVSYNSKRLRVVEAWQPLPEQYWGEGE